jgi:sulfite exporter TauE/SafE
MLSKLWGHLGTVLAGLGAGLADFHAVAASNDVRVVLTAVTGLLVATHVLSSREAKQIDSSATKEIETVGEAVKSAVAAFREAKSSQPWQAASAQKSSPVAGE